MSPKEPPPTLLVMRYFFYSLSVILGSREGGDVSFLGFFCIFMLGFY